MDKAQYRQAEIRRKCAVFFHEKFDDIRGIMTNNIEYYWNGTFPDADKLKQHLVYFKTEYRKAIMHNRRMLRTLLK